MKVTPKKTTPKKTRATLAPAEYWEIKATMLDFQRREQALRLEVATHAATMNQFWRTTLQRVGLNPEHATVEFLDASHEIVQA